MRAKLLGDYFNVNVSAAEISEFKRGWPCSGLPSCAVWFQFSARNGDLVDIRPYSMDGEAASALAQDAMIYGARKLRILDWHPSVNTTPQGE